MFINVVIQNQDFSLEQQAELLRNNCKNCGAIVSFVGLVRELDNKRKIKAIWLEHYPQMTEKSITDRIHKAQKLFEIDGVSVIHRVGELLSHEQIVLVVVASRHRKAAFSACEYIMDYLKAEATIWKKEIDGIKDDWVASKATDVESLDKWQ